MADESLLKIEKLLHGPRLAAAVAFAILLGACESLKENLTETDKDLQAFFGTDTASQPGHGNEDLSNAEADALYRHAVVHKERGETQAGLRELRRAAELGHREANYELGETYRQGLGVKRDTALAARYYGNAAVAGHADAQYWLAEAFANGHGVEPELSWAMRWYGKAAYQGHAKAQFAYGVLLGTGRGLAKNQARAFGWLTLAEQQGISRAATVRQAVEKHITVEERAASQSWAQQFRPRVGDALTDPPTVIYIQHVLKRLGYGPGPEDGILGSQTRTAVKTFKSDQGLSGGESITAQFLERLLLESRRSHS